MKKKDMNLYERYRKEQKAKANHVSPLRLYIAIIIGAVLVSGAYGGKLFIDNMILQDKISSLETYVNDADNVALMSEIQSIQTKLSYLNTIDTKIDELNAVLAYIPKYDSALLDVLYYEKPSSITYVTLSYEDNTVSVEFTAKRSSDASNYALRLQHTAAFADVSYEGYKYDETNGVYRGVIHCILKGDD